MSWYHLTHFQEQDWIGPSSLLVSPQLALYELLVYGELMRRQRAGRRALHLPLLAIQQIGFVCFGAFTAFVSC